MNTFIPNFSDNSESYVEVSEAGLWRFRRGKKGIFISHKKVMKGLRELIEKEA